MLQGQGFIFHSFCLDTVSGCLWRGTRAIPLRPKTFAVLRFLVERAGQLVTKDELLAAIWTGTYVSDSVPIVCIRELRKALKDTATAPRFIQAVPRRGYRFIAEVTSVESGVQHLKGFRAQGVKSRGKNRHSPIANLQSPIDLIGRVAELDILQDRLEKASRGKRQIIFVTGEPGIGKTTLLDAFLERVAVQGEAQVGVGMCVEHYGVGEAYLPVLDAFGRLCRGPAGKTLIRLLDQHAPTWLVQMPSLLSPSELDILQRKIQGATRERMLREMAEVIEALAAERPLVLVFEDLQWTDYSTLDLIAYLARRREPARLLLIASYRPAEVLGVGHPLQAVRQELQAHGQCEELSLKFLTEAEVSEYLATRFPEHSFPVRLAQVIHQRTEGNPLFMVNATDYLLAHEAIQQIDGQWQLSADVEGITIGVPENLRRLIEKHLEKLSPEEQRVLEAASVAGVEFSAAAVAAALEEEVTRVERWCATLVRHDQFLRAGGVDEWPDGTVAGRYSFVHALYQNVLYERLTAGERLILHRRIGERKEAGYGYRVQEITAELVVHFAQGRHYQKAVQYLQQAGENALRRYAYREALGYLIKGLEILKHLPDCKERTHQELGLYTILGSVLIATKGWGAPEVEQAYSRARELCQQIGETAQLFPVIWGLWAAHFSQGKVRTAREDAEQLLLLAQQGQDSDYLVLAHEAVGAALLYQGDLLAAKQHFEQALRCYHSQQPSDIVMSYGIDVRVGCLGFCAWTLSLLGYLDQARQKVAEVLTLTQNIAHPHSRAFALFFATRFHQFHGETQIAQEHAEALVTLSRVQEFPYFGALGTIQLGQLLVTQGRREEGLAQIHQGMNALKAVETELGQTGWLAFLADSAGKAGQGEDGLAMLTEAEAAIDQSGERFYEAEIYRLQGELTLQKCKVQSAKCKVQSAKCKVAEGYFHKAIEIARHQSAKLLELRATVSLSRLWQQQEKREDARKILTELYSWFTEGFATTDLQEARALLEELASE